MVMIWFWESKEREAVGLMEKETDEPAMVWCVSRKTLIP